MIEICLSIVLCLLLILLLDCILFRKSKDVSSSPKKGICENPSCGRCQSKTILQRDTLMSRLDNYIQGLENTSTRSQVEDTISEVIKSIDRQEDIIKDTMSLSGCGEKVDEVVQWMVPGLLRKPFWSGSEYASLREVFYKLQSEAVVESLTEEYHLVKRKKFLWSVNQTNKGRWEVLKLFDQGTEIVKACKHCPKAHGILQQLQEGFMSGNMFCYAMYSSLKPGSAIEPHTGPCNFRIRCHVPLIAPKGFWLQVGMESVQWERGKVLMFDDSLVHRVWSEGVTECRVVFIVDVWHPEVSEDLQEALNFVFSC